jgi:hypothetical protein
MTKKLEELFDLPSSGDDDESSTKTKKSKKTSVIQSSEKKFSSIEHLDKIAEALPPVSGLGERADEELNDIAEKALSSFEDLMDLGMNVESRYSGRIFEVANSMLKTGLDAKVAKIDKKLKMIELQLKQKKIDDEKSGDSGMIEAQGTIVSDRNSLLEKLKKMNKDK